MNVKKFDEFFRQNKICDINVKKVIAPLIGPGENYSSFLYKLDLESAESGQIVHAVLKVIPASKVHQELFNVRTSFRKEIKWFTEALPAIQKFLVEKGFGPIELFPKLLGTRLSLDPKKSEADSDALLCLENLAVLGFKNIDKRIGFDLKISMEMLRNLARLHAVPMAIKRQDPKTFERIILPTVEDLIKVVVKKEKNSECIYKGYTSIVRNDPELEKFLPIITESLNRQPFDKKEIREPWSTVLHNDLWVNNVMVKKEDSTIDIKFLDMQNTAHGSAACDLIVFLLSSVESAVLEAELDNLIKFYFEEFIHNLKGLNVETKEFSLEGLYEEIRLETTQGAMFCRAVGYTTVMLYENNQDEKLTDLCSENYDFLADFQKQLQQVTPAHVKKLTLLTHLCAKRNWI